MEIYLGFETQLIPSRAQKGKDARSVARNLGWGDIGGAFARVDDGNPVWTDDEEDSTAEEQMAATTKLTERRSRK